MCPGNGLTRYLTIAKQRGGTLKKLINQVSNEINNTINVITLL